jgi:arylsulfatase A-like enzyme
MVRQIGLLCLFIAFFSCDHNEAFDLYPNVSISKKEDAQPRDVIFILSDDHRFDFMGFTGKVPWLKTPNLDRLAGEGVYCPNTFVTTALCSPSRASILTGLYTHSHTVVDNQAPDPADLIYFPQYLQEAGYETAFFGKWHMGDGSDRPRPGFDHWESFKGQGNYYAPNLNINGTNIQYDSTVYITDLLTEHALDWLKNRKSDKPYFLFLSHKAVHADFAPAARHKNLYENEEIFFPPSFETSSPQVGGKRKGNPMLTDEYYGAGRTPDWQKMQRESWHGVDYMYHGRMDFESFFKRYCETVMGIDESIGTVMDYLEKSGEANSTLLMYMGDNGFSFGEHGLIDKRHFYEESVKVPFLARCPDLIRGGQVRYEMLQNIDIGPTVLDVMGLNTPEHMHGQSFLPFLKGEDITWRDKIFYEYYWEYDFPHTPTMHGVRTDRYKYIRYHGIWDTNEFYDLHEDPNEMNNLIAHPDHQERIKSMAEDIYDWLESSDGMQIPLKRTIKTRWGDQRNAGIY